MTSTTERSLSKQDVHVTEEATVEDPSGIDSYTLDPVELHELEEQWTEESKTRFALLPQYSRPSSSILFVVASLQTLSFTILLSPLPLLILKSICSVSGSMDEGGICQTGESQKILTNIQTILSTISGILGFFVSGKYGQWSDMYGRVFILKVFAIINLVYIAALCMYFVFYGSYSKVWMIVAVSIGYLNGGVMSLIANGNSYLNDIVPAEGRTVSISRLMSCIYFMLGVGPLLASAIMKTFHGALDVTVYVAMVFDVTSMMIIMRLTETRHSEAMKVVRTRYERLNSRVSSYSYWRQLSNFFKTLVDPLKRFWPAHSGSESAMARRNLVCLVLIDCLFMFCTVGAMHTIVIYTISRHHWSSVELGFYMSITGFGKAVVLLLLAPALVNLLPQRLGYHIDNSALDRVDHIILILCTLLLSASCLVIFAWDSPAGVYLSAFLQSLTGLISPTIQSSVIKYSSKTTAGEMFGAMALVRHLLMLISPVFFLQFYRHTVDSWPGCFLLVTVIGSLFALVLAVFGLKEANQGEAAEAVLDAEAAPLLES